MKKRVVGISAGVALVLSLIVMCIIHYLSGVQLSQTVAQRWSPESSAAQVSCFFSVNSGVTREQFEELEHSVDSALIDAGVQKDDSHPGARLWTDAYSADGTLTISNDKASVDANAIGIGGDFFLFHPLELLSGSYFSGNDVLQDYCILDQDVAWQLFGSYDITGMLVYIDGVPHVISGVVRRPEGRLEKLAGLDGVYVFVSIDTLEQHGSSNGINHYEIVMPNPLTGFAYQYISENLADQDGRETEVVENTTRYSFLKRIRRVTEFGSRSMNGKAIIYPFWENIARGYEDILTLLTLLQLILQIYGLVVLLILFLIWWKHKGWTVSSQLRRGKDYVERLAEQRREKRKKEKLKEELTE